MAGTSCRLSIEGYQLSGSALLKPPGLECDTQLKPNTKIERYGHPSELNEVVPEDRAIFDGYHEADIQGIRESTSNPIETLPADVRAYPDAVAHTLSQLRLVGVNGPYSVLLGAGEYTALAETRDHGYPVLEHVKRIVDSNLIWAPSGRLRLKARSL